MSPGLASRVFVRPTKPALLFCGPTPRGQLLDHRDRGNATIRSHQFENAQQTTRRLLIAIPISLLLVLHQAVLMGASVRLRAELLSALIGSISLIPFIISSGTGAEIEKPLAIVVVGGLVTRPIKIVILPMVYEWVERGAARRAARRVARRSDATIEQSQDVP